MKASELFIISFLIVLLTASNGYSNNSFTDEIFKDKPKKSSNIDENKIVIPVSDVKIAKRRLPEIEFNRIACLLYDGKIEAIPSGYDKESFVYTRIHPVIGAMHYGFAHHRPVCISPDMMWMMILQGFAKHISYNSDSLSPLLFADTSKLEIVIRHDEFVRGSIQNNWAAVFPEFSQQISKHTLQNTHLFFTQKFSTTTENISAAYTITMMDAFGDKFSFDVLSACGIPYVILEGSPEDWKWILENLPKLKRYGCESWIKNLEPIIEEIYNSSKGKINSDFWKSMYKWQSGSGGNTVTGWIIKFFPYLENTSGEKIINPNLDIDFSKSDESEEYMFVGLHGNDFSPGLSACDFTWTYYGEVIPMKFFGGFTGISQDKNLVLKPEISWFIAERSENVKSESDSISEYFDWQESIHRNATETDFIEDYEPSPGNFYEICFDPDTNPIFDPENNKNFEQGLEQFKTFVSELGIEYQSGNKVKFTYYVLPDGTCDCESVGALTDYSELKACKIVKYYLSESNLKWSPAIKNGVPVMVKQDFEVVFEDYE